MLTCPVFRFDDIDEDQDAEEVSPNFTFNYIEPKSGPFAKYIFCYRSMGEFSPAIGIFERRRG